MNLQSEIAYYTEIRIGDKARPADDVVLRMLLSPRADKVAEKMLHAAYRRALQNFERYDTTVFMNS